MNISSVAFTTVGRTMNTIGRATQHAIHFNDQNTKYTRVVPVSLVQQAAKQLFPNLNYGLNGKQFIATILAVRYCVLNNIYFPTGRVQFTTLTCNVYLSLYLLSAPLPFSLLTLTGRNVPSPCFISGAD